MPTYMSIAAPVGPAVSPRRCCSARDCRIDSSAASGWPRLPWTSARFEVMVATSAVSSSVRAWAIPICSTSAVRRSLRAEFST
jgi:hypothetical protein